MKLIIGTSGWWYDEWVGPFYDNKKGMLTHYSKIFRTTEINSTFYRYPTARMIQGWYRTAPPGFIYALKLPRIITHEKWLQMKKGVEDDTDRFLDLIRPLGEKLGPILIQLRPKFNYDEHAETLERYVETLPKNYEWAVEFRHPSWLRTETYDLLKQYNLAYTIVDEPLLPPEIHVTTDFAYIRWHGHGSNPWYNYEYKPNELEEWIPKLREVEKKSRRVYGYFNNHFGANAVKNAVEMLTMLGSVTREQTEALRKINEHKKQVLLTKNVRPLESFSEEDDGLTVVDLLIRFTNNSRLRRAEEIGTEELSITKKTDDRIEAAIRDYSIDIDLKRQFISHDCNDWSKGLGKKRICKHVAKLLLTLPENQAHKILTNLWDEKEKWQFKSA